MRSLMKLASNTLLVTLACMSWQSSIDCMEAQATQQNFPPFLLFDVNKELQNVPCQVQGTIPQWLSGTLLRNGPAKFTAGKNRVDHWFDGLAMIHSFNIENGHVFYSNKFLRTDPYRQMVEKGIINFSGFAQDPCKSVFKTILSLFIPQKSNIVHNTNVNIAQYADTFVALTETPLPVAFDDETLKTLGVFIYDDELPKKRCFESAHPHHDPIKKETINYLVRFGRHSFYVLWRMKDGENTREIITEIPVREPSYMHSFATTENYVVFTEYPFVVNPHDLMLRSKAFIRNYKWKPELGTVFTIVDKRDGQIVSRIKAPAFFCFHHVNAYEKANQIFMDLITYPDPKVIMQLADKDEASKVSNLKLERFTVDLKSETLERKALYEGSLEMPCVNPQFASKPYRFAYAVDFRFPETEHDERAIMKFDVRTNKRLAWQEKGSIPSESLFIPSPKAKDEDDGVILSVIFNVPTNTSYLLVLDAKTMNEIARAKVTQPLPVGLHGFWNVKPKAK